MSNNFIHRFKSNYFLNGQGFQIRYDSSNEDPETNYMFGVCDGYFTTSTGNITSPSYTRDPIWVLGRNRYYNDYI